MDVLQPHDAIGDGTWASGFANLSVQGWEGADGEENRKVHPPPFSVECSKEKMEKKIIISIKCFSN